METNRFTRFAPLALVAAAYLYVFPVQPVIRNPNENVRFYMTVALVDHGTFAIDQVERAFGWVNDKARRGDHVYSVKAPGTSYLGVPAYAAYRWTTRALGRPYDRTEALWAVRVFASVLPTLLFLGFFRRWLSRRGIHPLVRDATFFAVALGSACYAYALLFVSHTVAACAAFASLACLADADTLRGVGLRPRMGLAFSAGFLAAAVTAFEYPGLVATVVLSVYALVALRPFSRVVAFGAGAAIPTAAVMYFQWRAFGSPLTPGHRFLDNPAFRALAHQGFFGATGFDPAALGLLVDPAYGLFPLTPLLVAAPLGFAVLLASQGTRRPAAAALLIVLGTAAAIACMNNWRGGWTVGPRYLVTVIPFVAWAAAESWDFGARRLPQLVPGMVVGLTAVGLLASGVPSAIYPHLPEAFTRPLPQLFGVLWRHDFAPYTVGGLFGLGAKASLLPLAAIGVLAAVWPLVTAPVRSRFLAGALAAGVFACAAAPLVVIGPPPSAAARGMLGHVTRTWRPEGRDLAARLRARLDAHPGDASLRARLTAVYVEEGRDLAAASIRAPPVGGRSR